MFQDFRVSMGKEKEQRYHRPKCALLCLATQTIIDTITWSTGFLITPELFFAFVGGFLRIEKKRFPLVSHESAKYPLL